MLFIICALLVWVATAWLFWAICATAASGDLTIVVDAGATGLADDRNSMTSALAGGSSAQRNLHCGA